MKLLCWILLMFPSLSAFAQFNWTTPIRLTTGNESELHPAISDGLHWLGNGQEELLAFSQRGKNICLLQTTGSGAAWSDRPRFITTDSADNDFPSLVRTFRGFPYSADAMLVWQGRRNGNLEIFFSRFSQNAWSVPQLIASNSGDDRFPHVSLSDSGYYATWERGGAILFAEYKSNGWSAPVVVSQLNDTLNHAPQVTRIFISPSNQPSVFWERRKTSDSSNSILCAVRNGNIWSAPDTLATEGDNRNPRVVKYVQRGIQFERREITSYTTMVGSLNFFNGKMRLQSMTTLNDFIGSQQNASVNRFMIITTQNNSQAWWHSASAWESNTHDSIRAPNFSYYGSRYSSLSPFGATANRNPNVSQGTPAPVGGSGVRFWIVWEAMVDGKWRLYTSNAIRIVDDVSEETRQPNSFVLLQNFPNPFNPTTRIEYSIPKTSHVSLKVFDVLGREVTTLVDEVQDAGLKEVEFEARSLSSGIYLYQLQSGNFKQTRKLALLR